MPRAIVEGSLEFTFSDDWHVVKYDDHRDYREKIEKLGETKAADFVAVHRPRSPTLYLIEVKDFRGYRIQNKKRLSDGELAREVGHKVRDTIAGVVGGHQNGNMEDWGIAVERLANPNPPIRVVLWLEEDALPQPAGRAKNQRSVIIDELKKRLRWLTTKIFVASIQDNSVPGLTPRNLPGAGQNP
ncbi:MAG TPA: hypothetical protein VF590_10310 [Isosphaeraceae bacterium]|jgi:hypothetical protein